MVAAVGVGVVEGTLSDERVGVVEEKGAAVDCGRAVSEATISVNAWARTWVCWGGTTSEVDEEAGVSHR